MRKVTFILTAVAVLLISITAYAADLPIDITAIGRHGQEQQDAISVRRGIDLFSETSAERNQLIAERRAQEREEIINSMFTETREIYISDPFDLILQSAIDFQMFSAPFTERSFPLPEEEPGLSLWLLVPIFVVATGIGLFIAIRTSAKRKEREGNVYNNYD